MKINWKQLIIAIAIPLAVGGISAFLTKDSMDLFDTVNKPPLSPPGWLFPVAWTILYVLMGIASYLVYTAEYTGNGALFVYGIQLALNFLWSPVFFNLEAYLLAFVILVVLWVMILITIVKFHQVSRPAAYLLIPYIVWVTFAGYLNLGIYLLN